jgi:hypothetical protein
VYIPGYALRPLAIYQSVRGYLHALYLSGPFQKACQFPAKRIPVDLRRITKGLANARKDSLKHLSSALFVRFRGIYQKYGQFRSYRFNEGGAERDDTEAGKPHKLRREGCVRFRVHLQILE